MFQITPIPAFDDNYIWLLHNDRYAAAVDPGDATPVLKKLSELQLDLCAILVTHHHSDHIGGVAELLRHFEVPVYAPEYEQYHFRHIPVREGSCVVLNKLAQTFQVMWLPGHTSGHIAYFSKDYLFCGDTLFGAGCGRLFEGTPKQMLHSLKRLAELPRHTLVFCTHEYTAKNIRFARTIEPSNADLSARAHQVETLRAAQIPSLPSTIGLELETNPFLRCQVKEIIENAGADSNDELAVFTALRTRRNHY